MPPLGIGFLASILENRGCDVKIIDLQVEKASLEKEILHFDPHLVGIATVTSTYPAGIEIARSIKSVWNGPVIMGGHHVSFQDAEALDTGLVDVVVRGEAERTIWNLSKALQGDIPLNTVQGISFKKADTIIRTPPAPLVEPLDELPWPARHLMPMQKYREISELTHVLMSRGCPYSCLFCSCTQMVHHTHRIRHPEPVAEEIHHITDTYSFEKIAFFDDFFTYYRDTVIELCELLTELSIQWSCATRVDYLDLELLEKMKDSGCFRIFVGAESGNQNILNKVSKGTSLEKIREVASFTKKVGIDLIPSFVIGLPWDTEKTIQNTVEFSRSLDVGGVWFLPMTPFPGTPLYDEAEKYGITIIEDDFTRYTTRSIVATNQHMSVEKLKELYLGALLQNPRARIPEFM